jgi:multiple sugar transport system substrate-binding protein
VNVRLLALAATVAMAVGGLSSCSSSGSGDAGDKVSLTYALWDKNFAPAAQKQIDAYHAAHPKVRITLEVSAYADYFTRLQAAATGGQAPDVFWMNAPNFRLYASNGALQPLSDVPVDTSVYPKSLVSLYSDHGKQFGLPAQFDTVALWYNKAIFDRAGLRYPDASWTWSTFQHAARTLTDAGRGVYGTAALLEGQEVYYNTIFQAGGYVVSPDGRRSGYADPRTIAGLAFWTDLIRAKASPSQQQMTDTLPIQMFESGKIAMYWGGSWDAVEFGHNSYTRANADVAPLPQGEQRATVIHGVANVVSARTRHKQAAEDFAAWLGSKRAALILAGTGTAIPAYAGTQQAWLAAHPGFHLQVFLDELVYAKPLPVSKNTAAWNTLETDNLVKAWSGSEPVQRAATDLARGMDRVLAEEK